MENQLQLIVKESGLEQTKADYILTQFQDYFKLADEWEKKAKTIIVTDEKQEVDMKMARTGRLFLREKRIAIEDARKKLKEQSLREGKAIDGIANVLKALIVPIEEYLEKQEKFIEIKKAEKEAQIRLEIEKKIEADRLKAEQEALEEQARVKAENERLKKEAEEKERALQSERAKVEAERKKQEEALVKERQEVERKQKEAEAKAKAEQDRLKKEAEEKLAQERKIAEDKFKAEQAKAFAEVERVRKENEAKMAQERAEREKERIEKERLEQELKNQIECPHCHKKFSLK